MHTHVSSLLANMLSTASAQRVSTAWVCELHQPRARVKCRVRQEMELEDAVHTALLTLKEGFEGQISGANIEVAVVGEDGKFRVLSASEVSDYLEEVE